MNTSAPSAPRLVPLAIFTTLVCWSSNFPTIRYILQFYDPLSMSVLRIFTGALVLGVLGLTWRVGLPRWRDLPQFFLFGLVGILLATLFLNLGLAGVTAGSGAFLIGTVPVFAALLARLFLGEALALRAGLGITVSVGGILLIAWGEGRGLHFSGTAGFVVGSALFQAIYYVFQKFPLRRYTPLQITCYAVWAGALWSLPWLAPALAAARSAPLGATLAVIYLGFFPTALAFTTWAYALSHAPAARVTSSLYALPLLAMSGAYLWLGELPPVLGLAGGFTALAGVYLVHSARR